MKSEIYIYPTDGTKIEITNKNNEYIKVVTKKRKNNGFYCDGCFFFENEMFDCREYLHNIDCVECIFISENAKRKGFFNSRR